MDKQGEKELMENGEGNLPFVFCKRKMENGSLFSLLGNDNR
jgi:hypothetical protein